MEDLASLGLAIDSSHVANAQLDTFQAKADQAPYPMYHGSYAGIQGAFLLPASVTGICRTATHVQAKCSYRDDVVYLTPHLAMAVYYASAFAEQDIRPAVYRVESIGEMQIDPWHNDEKWRGYTCGSARIIEVAKFGPETLGFFATLRAIGETRIRRLDPLLEKRFDSLETVRL